MLDNWMRLDFNKDGTIHADELRKRLNSFYEFLLSYHYIEQTLQISSDLYDQAKKRLKAEQQVKGKQET